MSAVPTIPPAPAVLPYPREDGYWLVENGRASFVAFGKTKALVLPFASRAVSAASPPGAPAGPADGLSACTAGACQSAGLDAELSLDNWYFGPEPSAEGRKPDRASAGQAAPPEGQPPAGGETAREANP